MRRVVVDGFLGGLALAAAIIAGTWRHGHREDRDLTARHTAERLPDWADDGERGWTP